MKAISIRNKSKNIKAPPFWVDLSIIPILCNILLCGKQQQQQREIVQKQICYNFLNFM